MISSSMIYFFLMLASAFFTGYFIGWFTLLRINRANKQLDYINTCLQDLSDSRNQDLVLLASRVDYLEKALLSEVRKK